jgi:hypothetical protein
LHQHRPRADHAPAATGQFRFFRLSGKINSVSEALALLILQQVRTMAQLRGR